MDNDLKNNTDPLTIEEMKERLHSKWERKNLRNGDEEDDTEDSLFMMEDDEEKGTVLFGCKQFKGRFRICGKFGHK